MVIGALAKKAKLCLTPMHPTTEFPPQKRKTDTTERRHIQTHSHIRTIQPSFLTAITSQQKVSNDTLNVINWLDLLFVEYSAQQPQSMHPP